MRLCPFLFPARSLPLCLVAAAVLVLGAPAPARGDPAPGCAGPDDREFPLTTRIRGGPPSYVAGGPAGSWYLDLTNTTRLTCADIHPVVVLVDDKHTLKSAPPRMEFSDGPRLRPVRFETTDEDELIGVFEGDGFNGFTVAPGATVTVRVRLSVTADTGPEAVIANAAVVQRRGADGDWVGQSNDYRFTVTAGRTPHPGESGGDQGTGSPSAAATAHAEAGEPPEDPSGTGPGVVAYSAAVGLVLFAAGGAVVLGVRRRR
ncbi:hypothetical protein ACIREM_30575 [Streptomyces shenzhenensis]|uniref:hypothetical protein n=1 Tax=Streptomyces shenzhenensis TaxID=943815 RepID=UPI00381FDE86